MPGPAGAALMLCIGPTHRRGQHALATSNRWQMFLGNDERCSYCPVIRDSTRNLISRRRTLVEVSEVSLETSGSQAVAVILWTNFKSHSQTVLVNLSREKRSQCHGIHKDVDIVSSRRN